MKPYCRLKIPYAATDSLTDEFIDVPPTRDGIKMAAWWGSAELKDRVQIAREGAADGSYVEAWRKVAVDVGVANEATELTPPKDDLLSILKKVEEEPVKPEEPKP